jgi:hypothetical protein
MRAGQTKLLLLSPLILIIGTAVFVLVLRPRKENEWLSMTKRVEQLKSEAQAPRETQSALHSQAEPGNAWTEYQLALDDAATWGDTTDGALTQFLAGQVQVDGGRATQLVALHTKTLERLRRGSRRSHGRYYNEWDRPFTMKLPPIGASVSLGLLGSAQAKIWRDQGRLQEAADLLFDMTVFARDMSSVRPLWGDHISMSLYAQLVDQFRELIVADRITPRQLLEIGRKLEIVAQEFPTLRDVLAGETLGTQTSIVLQATPQEPVPPPLDFGSLKYRVDKAGDAVNDWWGLATDGSWRFWFSRRLMTLDAMDQRSSYLERVKSIDSSDYSSAKQETDKITAEAEASKNPLLRKVVPEYSKVLEQHREMLALIALLRAASAFLATGATIEVADPFGGSIHFRNHNGTIAFWSIGSNGTNDDGEAGDIRLEIAR